MLKAGDSFTLEHQFSLDQVRIFASVTGDANPLHTDPSFVEGSRFEKNIVHGMYMASLISSVLGCHFPGQGTVYVEQSLTWLAPVYVDEAVSVSVTILERLPKGRARMDTRIHKADGTEVLRGEALIIVPRGR